MKIRYILVGLFLAAELVAFVVFSLLMHMMPIMILGVPFAFILVGAYVVGLTLDHHFAKKDLLVPGSYAYASRSIKAKGIGGFAFGTVLCVLGCLWTIYSPNGSESYVPLLYPFIPMVFLMLGTLVGLCTMSPKRSVA